MAICPACNLDMEVADGCILQPMHTIDGELNPIPFGSEINPIQSAFNADGTARRCHDCGILPGSYHHPQCDVEECPLCSGQYISCDCAIEDDE